MRMAKQIRNMPSEGVIRAYWAPKLWKVKGFDSLEEFLESGLCFACGWSRPLERAHILAKSEGGSDDVSNLHMLCRSCHKCSEMVSGDMYNKWFLERETFDGLMALLAHAPVNSGKMMRALLASDAAAARLGGVS